MSGPAGMEEPKGMLAAVTDTHPAFTRCPSAALPSPGLFHGMEKCVPQQWPLPTLVELTRTKKL